MKAKYRIEINDTNKDKLFSFLKFPEVVLIYSDYNDTSTYNKSQDIRLDCGMKTFRKRCRGNRCDKILEGEVDIIFYHNCSKIILNNYDLRRNKFSVVKINNVFYWMYGVDAMKLNGRKYLIFEMFTTT